jgi:dTDP-4-amino-4,6-dideoxygalactose transaminase
VITVPFTFVATVSAIDYTGAMPVFVDIDPDSLTIDVRAIEAAITPRTKAILPVHLYGQPADMDPILEIARDRTLTVIEDACQAHGARYKGRRVGALGHLGCFSFYPGKNLGAWGEAGALVTNDGSVADRVRRLRDHAQDGRHHHVELGFNMRMEGIQGAVLDVKLRHLDAWTRARQSHARRYHELLAGVPGLVLPETRPPEGHVHHLFVVLVEDRDVARALHDPVVPTVGTLPHQCSDAVCETALAGVGIEIGLVRSGTVACTRSRLRLLRIRRIWKPAVFGIDDKRCLAQDLPRPSMVLPEAVVLVAADR